MRTLIFLAFVFATVLTTSCSKDESYSKDDMEDFTNPKNILGTTWKSTREEADWEEDLEYALLIFSSTTAVECWLKFVGDREEKEWTGTFIISNDRIYISYSGESISGIIAGKKMNLTFDGGTALFIKQ